MNHQSRKIGFEQNIGNEQQAYNVAIMSLALAVFLSCDHMPHTRCWTSLRFTIINLTCHSESSPCMTYYQARMSIKVLIINLYSFYIIIILPGSLLLILNHTETEDLHVCLRQ